jgi:putative redox protein
MPVETFEFIGASGSRLFGKIEAPEATLRGWALLAHCFTCSKDSLAAARISRALARAGIGVLRFDFAGLGGSDGKFADATFSADVSDLVMAASAMGEAGKPVSLLVGHSLGGAAVIAAASRISRITAVATIGAPADVQHVLQHFEPTALDCVLADGEAEVHLGGRPFHVGRSFIEDLAGHDIEASAASLHRPLLVMHAPIDAVVGIDHASRLFLAAKHPKSFISLDRADHLLTRREDADYAAAMIAAWASRYLPPIIADLPQVEAAKGVSAVETRSGLLQPEIRSGEHRLIADEPISVGGLDSGLSPYELLSAGLAACTAMTMRLYAERKGLPLHRAHVIVEHEKQPGTTPPDRFSRTITLDGPLNGEQRQRLLSIADRCPVDLTLVRGSDVVTQLAARRTEKETASMDVHTSMETSCGEM